MPRARHSQPTPAVVARWPTWRLVERWHGYAKYPPPQCLARTKSEARAKFKLMLGDIPPGVQVERVATTEGTV